MNGIVRVFVNRCRTFKLMLDAYARQNYLSPMPQLIGYDVAGSYDQENVPVSVLDSAIWNMGVPKSKVTPSRKRMKHRQHVPDKIDWHPCPRCGEPKRPHRICKKNMEICAMREEDWLAKKEKDAASQKSDN